MENPFDVTWKNDASTETLVFLVRTLLSLGRSSQADVQQKDNVSETVYQVALDTAYNAGYHDYFDVTQKVC
eukprot:scaffold33570_cov126-Skeletonema_dohrnii-CCMP3373.AAC.5